MLSFSGSLKVLVSLEPGRTKLKLSAEALALLTDGIDLHGAKMRPWYERE
ncbi:MAG: hypothetical protein ACFUZC_11280 [Chthoniobacteraceae bacterium]